MLWIGRPRVFGFSKCRRSASPGLNEFEQLLLVEHRHAQLTRLGEFGSGIVARYYIAGFPTHRTTHFTACILDQPGSLFAADAGQRPGQDEGPSLERSAGWPSGFVRELQAHGTQ